ncbi:MAG: CoB--CoM heterodisulfide reductase iron-sulfur subunit B family protein [Desulfobacterales bacterium]|jgi:heterodisulfide reductase subunit B|nr:CoB--CoM heterodisulfide reductase iron-sulfur subunit B family protein [Desulfobacteraceae bacterium]MDY0311830.1 CoB--CoM heterodisulfide reductase iron-sulfur subunit B family protein [Desulfobacterales bacterium]
MKYLYYPGCSLEGTAREYDISTRAFMAAMGAELTEIEGWTCCGASAAEAVSELLTLVLPARNLALAEGMTPPGRDILVPCSACYLNLRRVEEKTRGSHDLKDRINEALAVEGLVYHGGTRTRHLLDVVSRDLGAAAVARRVVRPLTGIRVAPYYGCQCLRPYAVFDDPEAPRSMEPLIAATGADLHPWTMGSKCCGASHMNTKMEVGLKLVGAILEAAQGADAVVTVCPMCQINLEAYQRQVARQTGVAGTMTILYLPQLLGLAMGLSPEALRLDLNLAVTGGFLEKFRQTATAA